MFRMLTIALVLAATIGSAQAEQSNTAPSFSLPGLSKTVSLADYKGKVIYLDFWASWCGPCKASFPWMNTMQKKYEQQGVTFIAINLDREKSAAKDFLAKTPANFLIAFDDKGLTPKQYEIIGMPSAYIIGSNGKILHSHIGFNDEDMDEYESHIQQAIQSAARGEQK